MNVLTTSKLSVASAAQADSATKATQDSAGQQIDSTYIKSASVDGKVITFTRGDGTTFKITTQDTVNTGTYVTATWSNGTSWYRKWSDGWIEQGGVTNTQCTYEVINLITPFTSTNYQVFGNALETTEAHSYAIRNRTTTTFEFKGSGAVSNFDSVWYACGF